MKSVPKEFRRDTDGAAYQLAERKLEPLMFALGIAFVPVLLGPQFGNLSDDATVALEVAGWCIWGVFVLEYLVLLYLAPNRIEMVKSHKLDLLVVLIPFLRPLRFVKVVRLATAATGTGRAVAALKRIGGRPGFQPFFVVVFGVIVVGAALALAFEHEQPGSSLGTFREALWWSIVTCTTVGYGDRFPVTAGGQIVAVLLMIVGIAGLSMLTASISALFVDQDDEPDMAEVKARLERIEDLLSQAASQGYDPAPADGPLLDNE